MSMLAKLPPWKKQLFLGLGFFVVCLVYYFPAQLAWSLSPKRGELSLYGLNGSWHSGTAAAGQVLGVPVRDISWQLWPSPLSPLRGKISLSFADKGHLQTWFAIGWRGPKKGGAGLSDLKAELPMSCFAEPLQARGLTMNGRLALQMPKLVLKNGVPIEATGKARFLGLKVLRPVSQSLGAFHGEIDSSAQGVRFVLRDDGGPLAVSALLLVHPDGKYNLTTDLTPRDPEAKNLTAVLNFIGPADGVGSIRANTAGVL